MAEIAKLRTRLKNITKGVNEYRMTVVEAKALIAEIDELVKAADRPPQVIIREVEITTAPKVLDAGGF